MHKFKVNLGYKASRGAGGYSSVAKTTAKYRQGPGFEFLHSKQTCQNLFSWVPITPLLAISYFHKINRKMKIRCYLQHVNIIPSKVDTEFRKLITHNSNTNFKTESNCLLDYSVPITVSILIFTHYLM